MGKVSTMQNVSNMDNIVFYLKRIADELNAINSHLDRIEGTLSDMNYKS